MTLTGQTLVASAVDERFRIRGPYWRPGDSVLSEPWVALGESNVGHLVVPCGRNVEHARKTVERWRLLHEAGLSVDVTRSVLGAAVVNPRGEVVDSWGRVPVPGGLPRWTPLYRVTALTLCLGCATERWPGCWVTKDRTGCAECLPELEADDPRPWPLEPAPPRPPVVSTRPKTPKAKRATRKVTTVVSPAEDRLV